MITLREFSPSKYDVRGLGPADRMDWLVLPVTQNRDSENTAKSNFEVACKCLEEKDPEGADHEIHRFGHWACGWFEIIIVRPDTPAHKEAIDIEACLATEVHLDDEHYYALQAEDGERYAEEALTEFEQKLDDFTEEREHTEPQNALHAEELRDTRRELRRTYQDIIDIQDEYGVCYLAEIYALLETYNVEMSEFTGTR